MAAHLKGRHYMSTEARHAAVESFFRQPPVGCKLSQESRPLKTGVSELFHTSSQIISMLTSLGEFLKQKVHRFQLSKNGKNLKSALLA